MISRGSDPSWRTGAFAAALLAITLNFLQPLTHAALLRSDGPIAVAALWGAFCVNMGGKDDAQGSTPAPAKIHECCLGLTHAPAIATPPAAFVIVEPRVETVRFTAFIEVRAAAGIRDGPRQPRAPPIPV